MLKSTVRGQSSVDIRNVVLLRYTRYFCHRLSPCLGIADQTTSPVVRSWLYEELPFKASPRVIHPALSMRSLFGFRGDYAGWTSRHTGAKLSVRCFQAFGRRTFARLDCRLAITRPLCDFLSEQSPCWAGECLWTWLPPVARFARFVCVLV